VNSVWLDPETPNEQAESVEASLSQDPWPLVFLRFLECMDKIAMDAEGILDVGCGVGVYGRICQQYYPRLHYTGTDISPHMIEVARSFAPDLQFDACGFWDNDFAGSDIVLAAGVVEYTEDPAEALSFLLRNSRKYVILHRLHLTSGETRPVKEPTYRGRVEEKTRWNREHVLQLISEAGAKVLHTCYWDEQMSVVVDVQAQA
jgi:SAM-dependent methyltransferase